MRQSQRGAAGLGHAGPLASGKTTGRSEVGRVNKAEEAIEFAANVGRLDGLSGIESRPRDGG